jgi:mannose-6-phosphate isomerase-like protein (cupin superfamily)
MVNSVRKDTAEHYLWGKGCDGWRLVDQDDLSVIEERAPPGGAEGWHVHEGARQFFFVLEGSAVMRTAAGDVVLEQHSGVEVEPGLEHQFTNPGPEEVRFLVISAPNTRGDRINTRLSA